MGEVRKMSERRDKKDRRNMRKFLVGLLSNMNFFDRFRFVFTGNYYKPLKNTLSRKKNKKKQPGFVPINQNYGRARSNNG